MLKHEVYAIQINTDSYSVSCQINKFRLDCKTIWKVWRYSFMEICREENTPSPNCISLMQLAFSSNFELIYPSWILSFQESVPTAELWIRIRLDPVDLVGSGSGFKIQDRFSIVDWTRIQSEYNNLKSL